MNLTKQRKNSLFEGKLQAIGVKKGIVGRCVVATDPIRAKTAIGRVTGKVVKDAGYGSEYCMDLCDGTVLEPAAPFRYLNHGCEPNCELALWKVPQEGKQHTLEVWLHSLRKIAAGEELTIDYGWPASEAIPCQCSSENCREWVVAAEELLLLKQGRRRIPK